MMRAQLEQRQQRQQPASSGHPAVTSRGSGASSGLRNHAAESDSPYVRLHAETPVSWQILDATTLARARAENKPIFMHIGFLADHRAYHSNTSFLFAAPYAC